MNEQDYRYDPVGERQDNMLQLRLNTDSVIERLYAYLTGTQVVTETNNAGVPEYKVKQVGYRIMNDRGSQHIVNYVQGIINPSTVQGNYKSEMYENHIERIHRSVTKIILLNYPSWEMKIGDYNAVCDFIMNLTEAYMSRLINNEERKSYIPTQRIVESSSVREQPAQKSGFLGISRGSQNVGGQQ